MLDVVLLFCNFCYIIILIILIGPFHFLLMNAKNQGVRNYRYYNEPKGYRCNFVILFPTFHSKLKTPNWAWFGLPVVPL